MIGRGWPMAASLAVLTLLGACRDASSEPAHYPEQATVEPIEGSAVARITLTSDAARRLDIQTATVVKQGRVKTVPSAALFVDPTGVFWVYTSPEPLVFVRHEVGVDHEAGGTAYLARGPSTGTEVVTVGVPELYGAETGIGK